MNFIANSRQQTLLTHTQQVTKVASSIFKSLNVEFDDPINSEMVNKAIEIASKCHDLGKSCIDFQVYLQQDNAYQPDIGEGELFSARNPLHHEISLLLFDVLWSQLKETIEPKILRQAKHRQLREMIRYGIYWHHAEPIRDVNPTQILQERAKGKDRVPSCTKFGLNCLDFKGKGLEALANWLQDPKKAFSDKPSQNSYTEYYKGVFDASKYGVSTRAPVLTRRYDGVFELYIKSDVETEQLIMNKIKHSGRHYLRVGKLCLAELTQLPTRIPSSYWEMIEDDAAKES